MAVDRHAYSAAQVLRDPWPGALLALGSVLVLLLGVFYPTFRSMVTTWSNTETYTHGFLIVPIVLFVLWRQRHALARLTPQPAPVAAVALGGLAFLWMLGELVDVWSVRQFSVVLMIPVLVWLILGARIAWQMKFPLGYLLFAVPFGEFLVQPLMVYTADFTVAMVRLTGIPVYRDGMYFTLPTGNWSVVEACSGIRYLIASVALGTLYAYLMYRSWRRRLLFLAFAITLPILANGLRAYMIVMIGHLSDMQLAVGVDHLLYGWVFFGIVIFLMFWVGSFWREDTPRPLQPNAAGPQPAPRSRGSNHLVATTVLAMGVLVAAPAYAAWIDREDRWSAPDLGALPERVGQWQLTDAEPDWAPLYHHARDEWQGSYAAGGDAVGVYVGVYAEQNRHGKMVTWANTLIERNSDDWRQRSGGRG
ncbi:exosortase A, partial [Aquisalimonas sp.]|uniref:exosortase A n=2 Tax=Aquisalimonas sp. TaxID=1872621 RepID=UPI0025BB23C3